MNGKITIIVPCYNAEQLVQPLLQSIKEQDYEDFEVIFVNDGSTDNTMNVLNQFCSKGKGTFKVIDKENGGVGSARNAGLDAAKGDYIFFVDSDDYIFPQTLSKMAELMTEDVELAVGAYENHDKTIAVFPHIKNREKWIQITIAKGGLTLWNKLYRRDIIEQHHIRFDTTTKKSEDHLFTAEYYTHMSPRGGG